LQAALVLDKRENRLALRLRVRPGQIDELSPNLVRLVPLMLLFVQLLQVEQGILIAGIEPAYLVEGFERAIDEAAAFEIESQTEQDIRVFRAGQLLALQQRLMNLNRARDLAAFAVDVAENEMNLEGVGIDARGLTELLDRDIELVGDEEVQPEHVVLRIARAAAIDPFAVAQLVALPGLADGEAGEQGQQGTYERKGIHGLLCYTSSVRQRWCR
jgi:hypothetical protein